MEYKQHVDGDRYHKKIGFPKNIELPTGSFNLHASRHARREAQMDMHGYFELPNTQKVTQEMYRKNPDKAIGDSETETEPHVFEITVKDDGKVKFIALRKHVDESRDKVLIIEPFEKEIVTAWSNLKTNKHENFNNQIYVNPE